MYKINKLVSEEIFFNAYNTVIENNDETCKIPVYTRIKDEEIIARLNENLRTKVGADPTQINISELDIIGVVEVFNRTDNEFELCFDGKRKKICNINLHDIKTFCYENNKYEISFIFHHG